MSSLRSATLRALVLGQMPSFKTNMGNVTLPQRHMTELEFTYGNDSGDGGQRHTEVRVMGGCREGVDLSKSYEG